MSVRIKEIAFDKALSIGATNALNVCLCLKPTERITVITDNTSEEIAASLVYEIEKIGSDYNVFVLEDFSQRPMEDMPQNILDDLATSQVSIFACVAQEGELGSRIQMTKVVNKHKIRHAHMVNINKQIMLEGMRADFLEVDKLGTKLLQKVQKAEIIRVRSKGGTNIVAEFSPKLHWLKTSGIISVDKWGNLPGGEILTTPMNVNGTFIVDGVVGDYLCAKYGDLKETPITIEIKDSRIKSLHCSYATLLNEFTDYIHTDENSNRVGEFAIGINTALKEICGNILQDEKLPGVHLAFGNPYGEHTGANWVSTTHIDCVGREFDIEVAGEKIMEQGQFLI
ncbi:MAG: aminopeptidase [Ignavibacteriales bacterium]|nr:aminopeptidase [Ignavibacteriales bacterium]